MGFSVGVGVEGGKCLWEWGRNEEERMGCFVYVDGWVNVSRCARVCVLLMRL